jgi:hypothetical protein
MKQFLLSLLLWLYASLSYGQVFERQHAETAEAFVKRITKLDDLPHPVIETREWDSARKTIIYFDKAGPEDNPYTTAFLLVPTTGLSYQRVLIDSFYEEGGPVKIETVFFANCDGDKEREIIVLVSWLQVHRGAGTYGHLYGTYIYDAPNVLALPQRLTFYKALSEKLDGGFEGDRDGKPVKATYKTVNAIKMALKKMGY